MISTFVEEYHGTPDRFTSSAKPTSRNEANDTVGFDSDVGTSTGEDPSDDELIALATELFAAEKVLEAYKQLQNVKDTNLLDDQHRRMRQVARECDAAISDLLGEPGTAESGWTKQGESHGHHDTVIYYKVESDAKLTCRLETPIESSLLVPLLSVLNESNLYTDWAPSWTIPKIGIRTSQQLQQIGRANQILKVAVDIPWPFSPREVVMKTTAVDDIDTNGYFAVRLHAAETGGVVPPVDEKIVRVDFEGAMLFRPCPLDHSSLVRSRHTSKEPMILVSFKMWCDAKIAGVPTRLINFVTRTVIGEMWGKLLQVADDVKAGERPNHKEAIESQPEFYQFVQERIASMFEQLNAEQETNEGRRFISYLQS